MWTAAQPAAWDVCYVRAIFEILSALMRCFVVDFSKPLKYLVTRKDQINLHFKAIPARYPSGTIIIHNQYRPCLTSSAKQAHPVGFFSCAYLISKGERTALMACCIRLINKVPLQFGSFDIPSRWQTGSFQGCHTWSLINVSLYIWINRKCVIFSRLVAPNAISVCCSGLHRLKKPHKKVLLFET